MTQQNSVSGRNHLTCAFHTSGHILGLSTRLSPSLTISHPHIKFRAAILQAQLTHLTFSFFFMWPLLELSSRLSSRFLINEGYPPGSASLSHIFLTIWDYSSHRDPKSIIIQISIHISQFHHIFHILTQIHMSMFLSHFLAHSQHISIYISYLNHKSLTYTIHIPNSHHITIHANSCIALHLYTCFISFSYHIIFNSH